MPGLRKHPVLAKGIRVTRIPFASGGAQAISATFPVSLLAGPLNVGDVPADLEMTARRGSAAILRAF
jgi:hypothetical protein